MIEEKKLYYAKCDSCERLFCDDNGAVVEFKNKNILIINIEIDGWFKISKNNYCCPKCAKFINKPHDEFKGQVCYSPEKNRFFQIREDSCSWSFYRDFIWCGGFTDYYGDSKTTLGQQPLSKKFIVRQIEIGAIDKLGCGVHFDCIGWCVKE